MTSLNIFSPAKVNLFLKVLKKRLDGYHEIITLMQPISIYDEILLDVSDGSGIFVECNNKNIPLDRTNLAYRAAEMFLRKAGIQKEVHIRIKKNIPAAAGLGGGSSNAASVLKGLNNILPSGFSTSSLMEIGAELGSDVPFFILNHSAIAYGRGEKLDLIEIPGDWYVIVNPGFPVSTAWVYGNLLLTKEQEDINIPSLKNRLKDICIEDILENDLEGVTVLEYPDIKDIKSGLRGAGAAGALMSGSGSTVFGVFENKEAAGIAFIRIKNDPMFKNMAVFAAQGL